MNSRKKIRPAAIVLYILAALLLLLICHAARAPYNILPGWFRYSLCPVTQRSYEGVLQPGDLAICDKSQGRQLAVGDIVRYVKHPISVFAPQGGVFGRVYSADAQSDGYFDLYNVMVNYNGQNISEISARPEYVLYRVAGLGGVILFLHSNQYLVYGACLGVAALYFAIRGATAYGRRLRRNRKVYLAAFEKYGAQYEAQDGDY